MTDRQLTPPHLVPRPLQGPAAVSDDTAAHKRPPPLIVYPCRCFPCPAWFSSPQRVTPNRLPLIRPLGGSYDRVVIVVVGRAVMTSVLAHHWDGLRSERLVSALLWVSARGTGTGREGGGGKSPVT